MIKNKILNLENRKLCWDSLFINKFLNFGSWA
jgi:hypothetical protein